MGQITGVDMKRYNCPNCGAGITGESCQYCGTVIYDFAAIQLGKPSFVKLAHNGGIYMFRMIVDDFTLRHDVQTAEICDDSGFVRFSRPVNYCLDMSFNAHCVPMDNDALMVVIKE